MRTQAGFSLLETLGVLLVFSVLAAVCAPSVTKATRTYQLQSSAQQIAQEIQHAKVTALSRSARQTLVFNTTTNTIAVNGTTITLPTGVRFQALPSSVAAPLIVQQAAQNSTALTSQQSDAHSALSFTTHELGITAKGLPDVEPGVVNWLYLVNQDGQRVAVTVTSAGSVAVLSLRDSTWK